MTGSQVDINMTSIYMLLLTIIPAVNHMIV